MEIVENIINKAGTKLSRLFRSCPCLLPSDQSLDSHHMTFLSLVICVASVRCVLQTHHTHNNIRLRFLVNLGEISRNFFEVTISHFGNFWKFHWWLCFFYKTYESLHRRAPESLACHPPALLVFLFLNLPPVSAITQ